MPISTAVTAVEVTAAVRSRGMTEMTSGNMGNMSSMRGRGEGRGTLIECSQPSMVANVSVVALMRI